MAGCRVLESSTLNSVVESFLSSEDPGFLRAALLSTLECICELLSEYPDVLSTDCFTASPPGHGVGHHLLTQPDPPVFAKARRLDPDKIESAKKEFASMEEAGIIRRSTSPWSSPLHMVKKKDGTWRPCGDYGRLNNVTVPDQYPLPNIADFSARVSGSKFFSKLDLQKGYYQDPMVEDDIKKTAIITLFGMFEFLRLPFSLRNTGQTFQRLMDQVLGDLLFCFVYVNNILIFSPDISSHVDHLREVFELCRLHSLTIGLPKCKFLGHNLNSSRCHPLVKHTSAIREFPAPTDKPALQRFLGMVNFFRKFIKELLAAYSAISHFHFMLEGRSFTLFTDHKPLTFANSRTSLPWSARQQRHLSFISEFTSSIVHLPGAENCVADALSCPTSSTSSSPQFKTAWTQTCAISTKCVKTVSPGPIKPSSDPNPESKPSYSSQPAPAGSLVSCLPSPVQDSSGEIGYKELAPVTCCSPNLMQLGSISSQV